MMSRRIEADRLAPEFVDLVEQLRPGDELLITRDGVAFAAVTPTRPPSPSSSSSPLGEEDVRVVATAMKLSESARTALSEQLGAGYIVLDMHSAPADSVDVLLVPPISPQLIGSLSESYPKSRVVIAEIEDKELGIRYEGPVRRLLDAGADTYLPVGDIPRLAKQLDNTMTHFAQLDAAAGPLTIESAADE